MPKQIQKKKSLSSNAQTQQGKEDIWEHITDLQDSFSRGKHLRWT